MFVDNLTVAAKVLTGIGDAASQTYEGVTIVRWDENTAFKGAADVVIETFACDLPSVYLTLMQKETTWVNVDYLSAESWVPEFHALSGKHHETNLTRHFYFPGFNKDTGGLIREKELITRRNAFQQSADMQAAFWQPLAIDNKSNDLKISLFSYPNAPVESLLQALAAGESPVTVLMPWNSCVPKKLLGYQDLVIGDCLIEGALTLHLLPFLSQDDYDKLLWACDVNFVRGEDSWVRAIWAGKPFIWQPYWQEDNAHLFKLNAFLESFYDSPELKQTLVKLHEAWSIEHFPDTTWQAYITNLPEVEAHTRQQSDIVIKQESLAAKLVAFCVNLAKHV